jgi:hypothetical protein
MRKPLMGRWVGQENDLAGWANRDNKRIVVEGVIRRGIGTKNVPKSAEGFEGWVGGDGVGRKIFDQR